MIKFERYTHINDLLDCYSSRLNRDDIKILLNQGIDNMEDARILSKFAWEVAGLINEDEENNIEVFGSTDNTEMIPDLSYEITMYMKKTGYYSVWEEISDSGIE